MFHALLIFASLPARTLDLPVHVEHVANGQNSLTRLSNFEIRLHMRHLPDWTTDGTSLYHTRTFANFIEAVEFVNRLVEPSEDLGHHPDITINYNRISLELTTHDAGGLTELDFQLATTISQL
ncbi:MAG: 4a-hydroxytetrahydrobiopterin dehydratase [Cyanobacteria bacterium J06642_11]